MESKKCIDKDCIILGAGPAGLQLGTLLEESGRDYLIVEKGQQAGEFFRTYPRHRKLISINKVHTGSDNAELNLRQDWNSLISTKARKFSDYTEEYFPDADDYLKYLGDFARSCNLQITYEVDIVNVSKREETFELAAKNGAIYRSNTLVIATGFSSENRLDVPGSEWVDYYSTCSIVPEEFTNKRVMVIGKGNSAFETGENLLGHAASIHIISPNPIKMAWKTHYVGHLRAVNNSLLDTYQLKSQNSVQNAKIICIDKVGDGFDVTVEYTKTAGERRIITVDHVIGCVGFRMDSSIFDASARPDTLKAGKYPNLDTSFQSENVPGMFFSGTLMHGLDFGKTSSGFVHGFRYNVIALFHILEQRKGVKWPSQLLNYEGLNEKLMGDLLVSSPLFLQAGFLSNIVSLKKGELRYYENIPSAYVTNGVVPDDSAYVMVTLEFGKQEVMDPFDANDAPNESTLFIHPVFRLMHGGSVHFELHLSQDLENQWNSVENMRLLSTWLRIIPSFSEDLYSATV